MALQPRVLEANICSYKSLRAALVCFESCSLRLSFHKEGPRGSKMIELCPSLRHFDMLTRRNNDLISTFPCLTLSIFCFSIMRSSHALPAFLTFRLTLLKEVIAPSTLVGPHLGRKGPNSLPFHTTSVDSHDSGKSANKTSHDGIGGFSTRLMFLMARLLAQQSSNFH